MILSGSRRFSIILSGSRRFSVVLSCSRRFSVVLPVQWRIQGGAQGARAPPLALTKYSILYG